MADIHLEPGLIESLRASDPATLPDDVLTSAHDYWPDRDEPIYRAFENELRARLEEGRPRCIEHIYFTVYRMFRDSDLRIGEFIDFVEPYARRESDRRGMGATSALSAIILAKAAYLDFVGDTEAAHTAYVEGLTIMARLINEGHDQYLGRYRAMLTEVPPDVPFIVDLNLMCEAWEIEPTNEPEVEAALKRCHPKPGETLH